MPVPHPAAVITILAVLLIFALAGNVSRMRNKHKVQPPAMTGHPEFERAARVHLNTVESAVMFLPLLWVATTLYSATIAFWLGVAWLVGRVAYAMGYMSDPNRRAIGGGVSLLAILALLIVSIIGVFSTP